MGCLTRIGCLVVVVGAGAIGYWLYGDQLPSKVATAAGRAANTVSDAVGGVTHRSPLGRRDSVGPTGGGNAGGGNVDGGITRPSGANDASTVDRETASRITWERIGPDVTPPAAQIASLSTRGGPAFVTLSASELAGVLSAGLPKRLPASARSLAIALNDNQLLVRATIDATELAGDGTLGRLLGMALSGRDTLQLGGTLEPLRPGVAQYRVESLRIKGVQVPPRLIPTVIGALRRGGSATELAPNGIGLLLPKAVADLRIAKGRLTFYKAVPAR